MRQLQLLEEQVKACNKCNLFRSRNNIVFARGSSTAPIMIIAEAPGEQEDYMGLPFMGRSGKLLDSILEGLNLNLEKDIYICNIIKCRPPNNRKPTKEEISCCINFLLQQINLVKPKCIITLGNTSFQGLTKLNTPISKIRGSVYNWNDIPIIPTYHPSFLLRHGGGDSKPKTDFISDINLAINFTK